MKNKLDNLTDIQKIDQKNMSAHIQSLAWQMEKSLEIGKKIKIPAIYKKNENVCLVGMGGSATAADILINQDLRNTEMPVAVLRNNQLPGWIDKKSLVILISHSGETQETLEAFKDAAAREAKIIIIAEKGKLEELGELEGALVFDYDSTATARASLGYQFGFLIYLVNEIGFLPKIDIKETLNLIKKLNEELKPESVTQNNLAKHLAYACFDHQPIIVASDILKSVARRWKNQLNENAKTFASFDCLPEAMHNSIEGMTFPKRLADDNIYFILKNSLGDNFIKQKFEQLIATLDEKNIQYEEVTAQGQDCWQQKFSLVVLGDWLSFYLAILNGVDPTPVPTIASIKN